MKFNLQTPATPLPDPMVCQKGCLSGVLDLQALSAHGMVLHCRCPMEPLSEVVIGLQSDLKLDDQPDYFPKHAAQAHTITVRALVVSCREEKLRGGQPCYEVTVAFEAVTSELQAWMENFRKTNLSKELRNGKLPLFSWEAQEQFGGLN